MKRPVFNMLGDTALSVTFSDTISEEVNEAVLATARVLEHARIAGVSEVQPAFSSLCIHFDPGKIRVSYIEELVQTVIGELKFTSENGKHISMTNINHHQGPLKKYSNDVPEGIGQRTSALPKLQAEGELAAKPSIVEIPVVYGGENGPDLEWACKYLGISKEDLIRRHCGRLYRVYMIGFTPGFPYLGGMDESIALPRLPEPRKLVPAGSVGIAGKQTGIYPWDTPGGWRIIGRTNVKLFSPYRTPPSVLKPGDYVRFVPVEDYQPNSSVAHSIHSLSEEQNACRKDEKPFSVEGFSVEDPGFLTLVVDEGRFGYRKFGVPTSGAVDPYSFHLANLLCGNNLNAAALEYTLKGPSVVAHIDLTVAVTGARAPVTVDGKEVPMNAPVFLPKGSKLRIGALRGGARGYLAVAGGISVPVVLNSRSTYMRGKFGGYMGRALKPKDILPVGPAPDHAVLTRYFNGIKMDCRIKPLPFERFNISDLYLRIIPGPEATSDALKILSQAVYTVRPDSDRMGIRLDGPPLFNTATDIISSPVVPGTIQVSSDGKPMLLLTDSQTTGGYKRVAAVIKKDLPLAGQLKAGMRVRFKIVDVEQALKLAFCAT